MDSDEEMEHEDGLNRGKACHSKNPNKEGFLSLNSNTNPSNNESKIASKRTSSDRKVSQQPKSDSKQKTSHDHDVHTEDEENVDNQEEITRRCTIAKNKSAQNLFPESEFSPDNQYSDDDSTGIKKLKIDVLEKAKTVENINNSNFKEKLKEFKDTEIAELYFINCHIKYDINKVQETISTLKHLSFEKCDGDFYKIFVEQKTVEKITIINEDQTIDGFSHEDFNELMKKLKNVKHLVLKGAGTASYFDYGKYSFKIKKLETDGISFNSKNTNGSDSTDLLKSQKQSLEELRIKNLPSKLEGQKVIKYIINEMKLSNLHYGEIALIIKGSKQDLKEISASADQIYSCIEIFEKFPGIKFFQLKLNETDVDSEQITQYLSSKHDTLKNITEIKVIDKSEHMRLLGVFQELFVKLINVKKFFLESQDRNINAILDYCLKNMKELVELKIDSRAPRELKRLTIIKNNAPKLKELCVHENSKQYEDIVLKDLQVNVKYCKESGEANSAVAPKM